MTSYAPGLVFISEPNGTRPVSQLVGKSYCTIANGGFGVTAVCSDGAHAISMDGEVHTVCPIKLKCIAEGSGYHVAVEESTSSLYSWGINCSTGQLGQGACHQSLQVPARIQHASKFSAVSCGEAFTIAVDEHGGAHAWGENFDRQLGLYSKTKANMHLANAVIEELCFVPRLIPLSLGNPVIKVACGSRFALAITKGGVLYSWGAGECGQLGTGRCTRREVPAPVMLLDAPAQDAVAAEEGSPASVTAPLIVRDIACGVAHVVAADEHGSLYCWGLNKTNQLGLDTTRTQHFPAAAKVLLASIPDPENVEAEYPQILAGVSIAKVYAHGHSSAAIDSEGRVFTWGSSADHRLMHILPLQPLAPSQHKALSYTELRTQRMACAKGYVGHVKAVRAQARQEAAELKAAQRQCITSVPRPTLVQSPDLQDCVVHSFAFAKSHSAALVLTCLKKAMPSEGPRRSFSKLLLRGNGFWDSPSIVVKFTFLRPIVGSTGTGAPSRPATSSRLPAPVPTNPPRSCTGSYVDSNTLQCKPPKFSEPGYYAVTVSMDGTTFLPDAVEIFVHQELAVQKQLPALCDVSATAILTGIELHVTGLPIMPPDWQGGYSVRLQFTCLEGQAGLPPPLSAATSATYPALSSRAVSSLPADDYNLVVSARLVTPVPASRHDTRASTPSAFSHNDTDAEEAEHAPAPVPGPAEEPVRILVCDEVDLTDFKRWAGNSLYELRCQVSVNGQDFSSLKPPRQHTHRHRAHSPEPGGGEDQQAAGPPLTLLYAFNPVSLQPSCVAIERFSGAAPAAAEGEEAPIPSTPPLEILVRGSSFIPSSRVPKGAHVEASLMPCLDAIKWEDGFQPSLDSVLALQGLLPVVKCPVRCEQTTTLSICIDAEAEAALRSVIAAINAAATGAALPEDGSAVSVDQKVDLLPLTATFSLVTAERNLSLNADAEPVSLRLYRSKALEVVPSCCSAASQEPQWYTLLVRRSVNALDAAWGVTTGTVADSFAFHSAEAVVAVHVPVPSTDGGASAAAYAPAVILPSPSVRFLSVPAAEAPGTEHTEDGQAQPQPQAAEAFILQVELPPPSHWQAVAQQASGADGSVTVPTLSHLFLSCWLDGKSQPPSETWAKLCFHQNLTRDYAINPSAPKIGFVAGNPVTADLTTYCPAAPVVHPAVLSASAAAVESGLFEGGPVVPQQCVVRVRGAPAEDGSEGASVCVAGRLSDSTGSPGNTVVNFEVPELAAGMLPVQKTPKDKTMYFVDLSMDGGITFDVAESPLLFLKFFIFCPSVRHPILRARTSTIAMKSYLRYEPKKQFGVIASPQCNVQYDYTGNLAFTGAIQEVCCWNLRQGTMASRLTYDEPNYPHRTGGDVTIIQSNPCKPIVAVGYSDGIIRLYSYLNQSLLATLKGHRSMVVSLCFQSDGVTLASGGADCDIVLWDLVSFTATARLRGHKDSVTGISFLGRQSTEQLPASGLAQYLVSVSKDTLMKVWDLETQCCVQTIVGHRCEIWSVAVLPRPAPDGTSAGCIVVTGAADELIRGYRLTITGPQPQRADTGSKVEEKSAAEGEGDTMSVLEPYGTLERQQAGGGQGKCAALQFNPAGNLLAAQSNGKIIEIFRVRDAAEAKKKCKRRLKRSEGKKGEQDTEGSAVVFRPELVTLSDELELLPHYTIRSAVKVRGFAFDPSYKAPASSSGTTKSNSSSSSSSSSSSGKDGCRALVSLLSNSLEVYHIPYPGAGDGGEESSVPNKLSVVDLHGHRSDVRGVAVSGDGNTIATCSSEGIKTWSGRTHLCLATCRPTGYCLTIAFAPGGRYIVAGTKEGMVQIYDTASGECVFGSLAQDPAGRAGAASSSSGEGETGAAVWALSVRPDGKGFMSGGADQRVTFWDFVVTPQGLSAAFSRQLQMTHDVLCLRYTPSKTQDRLMVAVGLLDSTVRIYYDDSLRFFLSLYGHKLPVMCLDISYDSTILVSGSADKTVKIWGLDFGDCHRSLLAHEDSVTSVRFQPGTHYFFSAGKDGNIKYWDADRFEQILLLPGHRGSVWALEVSPQDGAQVVSVGQDRTVRVWERGEDLVFVEEERERALEAKADKAAESELDQGAEGLDAAAATGSGAGGAVVAAKSLESVKGGEMLMAALDLVEAELPAFQQHRAGSKQQHRNPLLLGLTPHQYLLRSLRSVKAPDLEQALLVLPFHYVVRLIGMLVQLMDLGLDVELCCRCSVQLLRCHQAQILHTQHLLGEMLRLRDLIGASIQGYRTLVGVNMTGLRAMKRQWDSEQDSAAGAKELRHTL